MNRDTIISMLSDTHSGSTTALFPGYKELNNGYWQYKNARYTPNGKQCDMFDYYGNCAAAIAKKRKNKRLIVIHDGDAIDGVHHDTNQLTTRIKREQIDTHEWLMRWFLNKTGFSKPKGDLLYYVSGTETHTDDNEDTIARDLGAEPTPGGADLYDFLPLDINGRLLWFLHHGGSAGRGYTEGDALRNWLKRQYWQCKKDNRRIPDIIISGHVHQPCYSTYVQDYHTLHGIILPSWQTKTRFGYMVAPTDVNKIGMHVIEIRADGMIVIPPPDIMNIEDETIKI